MERAAPKCLVPYPWASVHVFSQAGIQRNGISTTDFVPEADTLFSL